jgi:hypothetical protein
MLVIATFTYNPCLLIIITKTAFSVVVKIQTDNILIFRSKEFNTIKDKELTRAKFSAKPKKLLFLKTLLIFNSYILTQKKGDAVKLQQKKQGKKLKTVNSKAEDPQHKYREQYAREAYIAMIC